MPRLIDADKLKEHTEIVSYKNEWYETEIDEVVSVENIDSVPTIKTKQVKYYDDDEQVWKIGEVIVNSSEIPNNLSEIPTGSERSSE